MISVSFVAEDDLLDQGELDHVHPDLGVDDGAQRVEDRELGRAALGVERRRRWCLGSVERSVIGSMLPPVPDQAPQRTTPPAISTGGAW